MELLWVLAAQVERTMGWYKAFPPHLAPWNRAKRFLEGLAGWSSYCLQMCVAFSHWMQMASALLSTPWENQKEGIKCLYPPTHTGIQNSLFRFSGSLSNLWRELSICLTAPSPAHMDSFDFDSLVSGSIFGPSTTFFGKRVLHAGIPG